MTVSPDAAWAEVSAGGVRWWAVAGLRDALLGPDGLRLDEWRRNGRATVVKHGPHRVVYRVCLDGGPVVYIKHNLLPDLRAWLRQLVRPSKARTELERARAVAARGLATIQPVALGERRSLLGACESYLVTLDVGDTQTLNSFLATTLAPMPPRRRACVQQRLARALGRFVAHLHDAGIRHHDLHAANVLVHLTADDRPSLFLIDLNAVHLSGRLDWPASLENLVLWTRWFLPRVSRADRLRFYRAYHEARGLGIWPRGCHAHREHFVLARQVEEKAWESMLAFWKRRDRRCFSNNRYFRRIRRAGLVGHALADADEKILAELAADPDGPFRQPGVRLLKDSPSSTVAEVEWMWNGQPRRLIYKRFRVADWTSPYASLARPSSAWRAWRFGASFRERCLATARPLLVLHRVRGGLFREGYLLTEKLEDAVDLHAFAAELETLPAGRRRKRLRQAIDAVAHVVRRLHENQLSHRDLKASNVFLANDLDPPHSPFLSVDAVSRGAPISSLLPLPASPVWFIDLVGVSLHGRLRRSRRVQNLARLHASFHQSRTLTRTDKLRFLRCYLVWNLVGKANWKAWWMAIQAATERKVARNSKSGRVLA